MSGISPISPVPWINIKPVKPSPRDEERDDQAKPNPQKKPPQQPVPKP